MANPIDQLMIPEGPSIYYNELFRVEIESHLTYLRHHNETLPVEITPTEAYRFEGDLTGLLLEKGVPKYLHWTVMRINDMTSVTEVSEEITFLLLPSESVVENIRKLFMVTHKIS